MRRALVPATKDKPAGALRSRSPRAWGPAGVATADLSGLARLKSAVAGLSDGRWSRGGHRDGQGQGATDPEELVPRWSPGRSRRRPSVDPVMVAVPVAGSVAV